MALIRASAVNPTAMTALYTCAAAGGAVVSSLAVCNTTTGAVTVRLRLAPLGAADAIGQAVWHDRIVLANETIIDTIGLTMLNTDVLRVMASVTGVTFHCWGQEL